jgi:hypothetical protein
MTRTVTMSRDELDRRIARAVAAALSPDEGRRPPSFRAVRDPATGRIDMVPAVQRPWGEPGTSPAVVGAVGQLLYDRCGDDTYSAGRDFAAIGLVRSAEFLFGHADEDDLGSFARDFMTVARGHQSGSIVDDCSLVLDFQTSDTGRRLSFTAQMTCESVVFAMFERTQGAHLAPPLAFFYDDGDLGEEEAEFSLTLEELREEDAATRRMLAKLRRAARPAAVLDMDAFRARRAG